jgi:hypothetical protein
MPKSDQPLELEANLGGSNAVHKRHLLEAFVTEGDAHFPAIIYNFMYEFQRSVGIVHFVFDVQVNVVLKSFDL